MRLTRLIAAPVAAGALMLAQLAGAGPARATTALGDPACNYDYITFNACLRFWGTGEADIYRAVVGLDAYMSRASAQDLVNHGTIAKAQLWSDEGRYLADLTTSPGFPAAGPDGLGVELYADLSGPYSLDEDLDGEDEIYAKVSYYDYRQVNNGNAGWVTKTTGIVHYDFTTIAGGGEGCFLLC
jgi:hypothetical protein